MVRVDGRLSPGPSCPLRSPDGMLTCTTETVSEGAEAPPPPGPARPRPQAPGTTLVKRESGSAASGRCASEGGRERGGKGRREGAHGYGEQRHAGNAR